MLYVDLRQWEVKGDEGRVEIGIMLGIVIIFADEVWFKVFLGSGFEYQMNVYW